MQKDLTAARLRELLNYDPETGLFRWRINKSSRARLGSLAGSLRSDGYVRISVDGTNYQAHRLVWLYTRDVWPNALLDHANGVRSDNRLANLRDASSSENSRNQRAAHRSNKTSGLLGVSLDRESGKWRAQIWVNGSNKSLGLHTNKEDAHVAYLDAKKRFHGVAHFARGEAGSNT